MTQPDKLFSQADAHWIANYDTPVGSRECNLAKQLADTMHENERLREALMLIRDNMDKTDDDYYDGWTNKYYKIAVDALQSSKTSGT